MEKPTLLLRPLAEMEHGYPGQLPDSPDASATRLEHLLCNLLEYIVRRATEEFDGLHEWTLTSIIASQTSRPGHPAIWAEPPPGRIPSRALTRDKTMPPA